MCGDLSSKTGELEAEPGPQMYDLTIVIVACRWDEPK